MRLILWLLAGLALLVAALFLTGSLLPAAREGRAGITIAAPPGRVLALIEAVEQQPDWREGLARVTRTPQGWVETTARGEEITFTPEEMTEARIRLRFTSSAGYQGTWEATLTPVPEGTRIDVVERAEIASPLGRILARLFFNPEAFATTYLQALKARSEI